ncbi:MBOAT family O-acyltransferase [Maribacter orientalis]
MFSSLLDYLLGKYIYKEIDKHRKKLLLFISLFFNLGFLIYFKYFNFFIESFVDAFSLFGSKLSLETLNIILPVGISFYTFQTLSYTIDIYRGQLKPAKNGINFFAFVSFFPQLVAGPIERASHLLPQFDKVHKFNYEQIKSGLFLILYGLFKKMVIADRVALYVNEYYSNLADHNGLATLVAILFFAIQIYCDFSGYSDIAIGVARSMGFDLMKNFDTPYFSKSITEFWRRWHISLSTWFRDYVFIPLGGSRKSEYRVYLNLFIVFVISGLWHGASINFVIWGALHGLLIVLEKYNKKHKLLSVVSPTFFFDIVKRTYIFILVCFSWIFFRADTFNNSLVVIKKAFGFKFNEFGTSIVNKGMDQYDLYVAFFVIILLFIIELFQQKFNLYKKLQSQKIVFRWSLYLCLILLVMVFGIYGDYDESKFIYFQF